VTLPQDVAINFIASITCNFLARSAACSPISINFVLTGESFPKVATNLLSLEGKIESLHVLALSLSPHQQCRQGRYPRIKESSCSEKPCMHSNPKDTH
jgi:hypothetical protein